MKNTICAIVSALIANAMVLGVELAAGINIELLPKLLILVPLTLVIEFIMLVTFTGGAR